MKKVNNLFDKLCSELKVENYNELKSSKVEKRALKLDHNSVYGGYRIDWVNPNTSEDFFSKSERLSNKEMVVYIEGLLFGLKYKD